MFASHLIFLYSLSHSFNLITAILIRESIYNPTRWQKASPSDLLGIPSGYLLEKRRLKTCVFPQCCILKMFPLLILPHISYVRLLKSTKNDSRLDWDYCCCCFLRTDLKLDEQLKCKNKLKYTVRLIENSLVTFLQRTQVGKNYWYFMSQLTLWRGNKVGLISCPKILSHQS